MELTDALHIPLAPAEVWAALGDGPLVRASFEHCESLARLPSGEFALTLTVPVGPLRARYDVRAHLSAPEGAPAAPMRRTLNFKACAAGVGSLRGQLEVALEGALEGDRTQADAAADAAQSTRIDYAIWATLTGPLAELPPRQIENALHALAEDFFAEFMAVVEAKYGRRLNRADTAAQRRRQVFLRPINMAGLARRPVSDSGVATPAGRLGSALLGHRGTSGFGHGRPHTLPAWGWLLALAVVAALLYVLHRLQ